MNTVSQALCSGLQKELDESIGELSTPAEYARNCSMAERINSELIAQDGTFFVAAGTVHFAGKSGLPSLLSKRYGWTVEKIDNPLKTRLNFGGNIPCRYGPQNLKSKIGSKEREN